MDSELQLDDEQRKAVFATERAIAVLAGPGSGKTRTLSLRAKHLLDTDPSASAMLLTFTNKAAAELKARALAVASLPSKRFFAGTFHTFAADILRAHGDIVGVPTDFEILDRDESREVVQSVALDQSLSRDLAKNLAEEWSQARLKCQEDIESDVAAFGAAYQQAKLRLGAVDFDDLVVRAEQLLRTRSDIAAAFSARYAHILVDEFQDTNAIQTSLIGLLAATAKTVSVFADDDQAIFAFAGAQSENVARFSAALSARSYPLTVNYRSLGRIVSVANALAVSSTAFSQRTMRAARDGGTVVEKKFSTTADEAGWVVGEISRLLDEAQPASSISILVRSGYRANDVFARLQAARLPVSDWRGDTSMPKNRRLLGACLGIIRGRLQVKQVDLLCSVMGVEGAGELTSAEFLGQHRGQPLADGLAQVQNLAFSGASPGEIVRAARTAVGAQNEEAGDAIDPLVAAFDDFAAADPDFTLEQLLVELALGSVDRPPAEGGGIKVASLHRTKGLQWRTVFLLGLEEGHLPDYRASSKSEHDEERRLCFVGVSRAQEHLVVTRAEVVNGYPKNPSSFLRQMSLTGV